MTRRDRSSEPKGRVLAKLLDDRDDLLVRLNLLQNADKPAPEKVSAVKGKIHDLDEKIAELRREADFSPVIFRG